MPGSRLVVNRRSAAGTSMCSPAVVAGIALFERGERAKADTRPRFLVSLSVLE
jgi:hypothetical protein